MPLISKPLEEKHTTEPWTLLSLRIWRGQRSFYKKGLLLSYRYACIFLMTEYMMDGQRHEAQSVPV